MRRNQPASHHGSCGPEYFAHRAKNGNVYDHIVMKWSCVADDVRNGKAGKLPNDVLANNSAPATGGTFKNTADELDGFVNLPDGSAEELPF